MILIIDDNRYPTEYYVEALNTDGFSVQHIRYVDDVFSALDSMQEQGIKPELIVLDIMMPPGETYGEKDTSRGLRTGELLYTDLRRMHPHVPIIVLTNVRDDKTIRQELGPEGRLLRVVQKMHIMPSSLVVLVRNLLAVSRVQNKEETTSS